MLHNTHAEYKQELQNELNTNLYYFEHKVIIPNLSYASLTSNKEELLRIAPKHLTFTNKEFITNKSFNSLYGSDAQTVYNNVKFFKENESWYSDKGLPYQLGMLFHGIPGCGKTACIKAIAKYTDRHIINVNFRHIKTMTQLKNLFFCKEVTVANGEFDTKKLFLPQSKRLYVLEEIDAISDIVKKRVPVIINTMESQRELSIQDCENYSLFKPINNDINTTSKPSINNDINTSIYPKSEIAEELEDELTLGGILTVLDGNLEVYSRMLIITSNHPETIDDALLRPGRIDLQVKFSKCDKKCIRDMYYSFFTKEPPELLLSFDGSPAELQQKLLSMYHAML